jgi:ribonuclease R
LRKPPKNSSSTKKPKHKKRKSANERFESTSTAHGYKPKPKRSGKKSGGRDHRKEFSNTPRDVSVLVISDINEDGELIGKPVKWDERKSPPHIIVSESGNHPALGKGDRILAKMQKVTPHLYHALVINVLPAEVAKNVIGVFVPTADGGFIEPISRKMKESYIVASGDTMEAQSGELVTGVTLPGVPSMSMTYVKVTERLGRMDSPKAASLIASMMHSLPQAFAPEVVAQAEAAEPPVLHEGRTDLRDIALVTIDGEDARDFDDAIFAEKDGDGWHLLVAIADVAYYVSEGSPLDLSAFERGNSVYFPDRVIPMLPERLSNGLCSLMPNQDRYCLAVHIWIDAEGEMQRYQFVRGLMRSRARLTYTEVQAAHNAEADHPLKDSIIAPLYEAYKSLAHERDERGALNLNLPEFKIQFDEAGNVAAIAPKPQLESHRLIESFMIAANVAAADFLLKNKLAGIYRVHEPPSEEKLEELKVLLQVAGYSLHVGAGIKAGHFNRILKQVQGKPEAYLVNTAILRSQMQAYYSDENLGHFGLGLQKYGHFTSPIRRYADLVVHRSLATAIDDKAQRAPHQHRVKLAEVALHISDTERRAMMAERDASDRYKVSYMSKHVGQSFSGVIVSLNEYGLYVALNDTGINGFIPVRNLSGAGGQSDFFHYDKRNACFSGRRSGVNFHIGQPLIIRVQTANATTGTLIFELAQEISVSGEPLRPKFDKHRGDKKKSRRNKR